MNVSYKHFRDNLGEREGLNLYSVARRNLCSTASRGSRNHSVAHYSLDELIDYCKTQKVTARSKRHKEAFAKNYLQVVKLKNILETKCTEK